MHSGATDTIDEGALYRTAKVLPMSASRYRTPGNSEFVEALGWCLWNFLYLEETIVRWLWLLKPEVSLSEWRKKRAFGKGIELGHAVKSVVGLPDDLRGDLEAWLTRYEAAVKSIRNTAAHAHAFTVAAGPDGWLPGLAYTDPEGHSSILAQSPDDLHARAAQIEALMIDLSAMESRLQAARRRSRDDHHAS